MPSPADERTSGGGRFVRRLLRGPWPAVLLGLACMASSIPNSFTYDDLGAIYDNPRIRSLTDLRAIWFSNWWEQTGAAEDVNIRQEPLYRPLAVFSFALNYALDGLDPLGYHLASVLLHALVCFLVWHFTRRLLDDDAIASVAAVLYAVHPIHAEAVANLVGRAEILATLFLLLGCLMLLPRHGLPSMRRIAAAAALFFVALLGKETAVCYPAVALLVLYAQPPTRTQKWRWWLLRAGCLLAPLAIYFPVRYFALGGRLLRTEPAGVVMNPIVMAHGIERVWGALTVLGEYIRLLVTPATLSCDYGLAVIDPRAGFTGMTLLGLLGALAALVGLVGFLRGGRVWRQVALLTAIFLASYALISNTVLLIGVSVAERLMYWPSVPVLMLAALGVVEFWRRQCAPGRSLAPRANLLRVLGVLFVTALGLRTAVRNTDWKNTATLAARDVRTYPQSAHLQYGYAMQQVEFAARTHDREQRMNVFEQARKHVELALAIEPGYADALALEGRILANLGGDTTDPQQRHALFTEASLYVEAALSLDPFQKSALQTRARLIEIAGGEEDPLPKLEAAVHEHPDDPNARIELARGLLADGQASAATVQCREAVRLAPRDSVAQRLLGQALAESGKTNDAIAVLERLIQSDPNDWAALTNCSALLAPDDPARALQYAERAFALQPNDVRVRVNLAESYKVNGMLSKSLNLYRQIERTIDPRDPFRAVIQARIAELQRG